MFEEALNSNRDRYNEPNVAVSNDLYDLASYLIPVNPFYDWLEENINHISYQLLKGFITNIVPLGKAGREYFEVIAKERTGFNTELIGLYNKLEKLHFEGTLIKKSYLQLRHLGYTGGFLGEEYPSDDITKYLKGK